MNFNGNSPALNHLIKTRRNPGNSAAEQRNFNEQRLSRVYSALSTRPFFLALKFELPAAGSVTPISKNTPELRHDVIALGAITNSNRPFELERRDRAKTIIYTGDDYENRFNLNEFAGREINSADFPGVFYFPNPYVFREGRFETFRVYKLEATAGVETAWLGFLALRVYSDNYAEANLTDDQRRRVVDAIRQREAPETHFVKVPVNFDSNGRATIQTPKLEEPHILRGIKTDLQQSLIKLRVEGEANLTSSADDDNAEIKDFVPLWTVCAQPNARELYGWQQRGLFIDTGKRLIADLINTLDEGTTEDDASATVDGSITLILETM